MKTHQVFIASYRKDAEWLVHCLASLRRFSVGFLPPVVCVGPEDKTQFDDIVGRYYPEASVVVTVGRPNQGFMRAQISMLKSDLLCPNADVIYWVGSDCIVYDEFRPEPYCDAQERPAVLVSEYAIMEQCHAGTLPWKSGVTRVLGFEPKYECMRRLPSVAPRSVFAPMRAYIEDLHKMEFEEYIYSADEKQRLSKTYRDTSEANILGSFAHKFMPETCCWVDIAEAGLYGSQVNGWPSTLLQLWSHGGLDRPMEACVVLPDGMKTVGHTPRAVINHVLYNIKITQ